MSTTHTQDICQHDFYNNHNMLLALNADNDSGGIFQGVGGDSIISEKVNNKHIKDICQLNLVNYHHVESKGAQNKIESTS